MGRVRRRRRGREGGRVNIISSSDETNWDLHLNFVCVSGAVAERVVSVGKVVVPFTGVSGR